MDMFQIKKPVLILLTFILLLTLTVGCGRSAVSDSTTSGRTSSDSSNSGTSGSTSSISADGMGYQFGEDLKLPRKFPTKVAPLYKESNIYMTMVGDDSKTWSVGYHSKANTEDVIDYYKKNYKNAENKSEMASNEGGFFFYESDGYEIAIIISQESDKDNLTSVVLTLTLIE